MKDEHNNSSGVHNDDEHSRGLLNAAGDEDTHHNQQQYQNTAETVEQQQQQPVSASSPQSNKKTSVFGNLFLLEDKPDVRFGLVFLALALYTFVAAADSTLVGALLPSLTLELNSVFKVVFIVSSYLVASTVFQPILGKLSDIFGRKAMFLTSVFFFLLGCALCGASTSIDFLIGARVIQGIGAAGLYSLSFIIVIDILSLRKATGYLGFLGLTYALASIVGPLIGGAFTDNYKLTWRWAFYMQLPIGAFSALLAVLYMRIPDQPQPQSGLARVDFLGIALFASGVVCMMLAVIWGGGEYSWNSPVVIALLCVGVVLLAGFIFVEIKLALEPVVPLELFLNRNYAISSVLNLLQGAFIVSFTVFVPVYFQVGHLDKAVPSALRLLPFLIAVGIVAALGGISVSRTGRYRPQIWVGFAISTVGSGLLLLWDVKSPKWQFIIFPLIIGIGQGLCLQTTFTSAQAPLTPAQMATGTALIDFFRTLGGGLGTAACATVLNNKTVSQISGRPDSEELIAAIRVGISGITMLPLEKQALVLTAYVNSAHSVFAALLPMTAAAFVLSLFLKHIPLTTGRPIDAIAAADETTAINPSPNVDAHHAEAAIEMADRSPSIN
ncbi:MFS general substrate transporter [Ramicandelaber brevisporus]|nr:MFS general substrate transporter [Ramicandelaber brevisporus]